MPVGAAVRNVSSISAGRAVAAYAALGGFGAILVPVSGFWLVLPQAILMLVVARRGAAVEAGRPKQTNKWAGSS